MDRALQEMQFLGLLGIYAESFKLIFRLRNIFTHITLTLILPLSLIFLAHEKVSDILYYKIQFNEFVLSDAKPGTQDFLKFSHRLASEWAVYVLLKILYFAFVLAFSLLATSAVVYTVACVYASLHVTFGRVMSVVPRVWRRLIVTFMCALFAFVAYNFVFGLVLCWWGQRDVSDVFKVVVFVIVVVLYAIGFVYMAVIWQLASVVSVMEDSRGVKAMIKSKGLIRGKMWVVVVISVKVVVILVVLNFVFRVFVMDKFFYGKGGVWKRVGLGVLCLLLLMKVILFGLVVQTVIYFVCKSHHRESIDRSALSDHLEGIYLGDYVPLKAADKGIQMEEYRV